MPDTTATDSPAAAPAAQEPDWAAEAETAERVLKDARQYLVVALDRGQVGSSEYARYAGMITTACQEAVTQHASPQVRAEIAKAACAATREQAIALREAGDICQDGLDEFLESAGLEPA